MAQAARSITAVDLEALDVPQETTQDLAGKVQYVRDDISSMDLDRQFDVVNCVGVIHHTDDPTITFRNLVRHLKPGGRMIIWAYAKEGNFLMAHVVEPFRKRVLDKAPHRVIWWLSVLLTAAMWPIVHTIYRLPLKFLPYYEYFENFRRLSFRRNVLNVYDKLNAPQQHFLSRETMESWFNEDEFCDVHLSQYKGVSWRASGTKRARVCAAFRSDCSAQLRSSEDVPHRDARTTSGSSTASETLDTEQTELRKSFPQSLTRMD